MELAKVVAEAEEAKSLHRIPEEEDSSTDGGVLVEEVPDFFADKFSPHPWERRGDVFPLPLPSDDHFCGPLWHLNSRRSRQRVHRRRTLFSREQETVSALNHLAGFCDRGTWPSAPLNRAQEAVLLHVRRAHHSRPQPCEKVSPQAALRQLLKRGTGYSNESPGTLASYVRERISLPRDQGHAVSLESILPPTDRHVLENFEEEMLLSPEEQAGVLEKGLEGLCYMDPVLANDPKKYHQFIADMHRSGLLDFTIKPKVQVGAFVVTKKGDKQRLIVDARKTNRLFRTPPTTLLGSMECWGRLEVDQEEDLFVAQEDVKDFFYRLGIDKSLGEYFSFPAVDPHLLYEELGFLPPAVALLSEQYQAPIYPHMQVLPMGFSWAFHLAHQAHVEIAQRTLPLTPLIRDRLPMQRIGGASGSNDAMLIYADNNNHVGVDRESVNQQHHAMLKALDSHGLATHDLVEATTLAESLGVRIDGLGGRVTPTATRDWRLDRALEALLWGASISGKELQIVVGHLTVRALLNRNLMGIMRHVYVFIERNYSKRRKLWSSVLDELWLFRNLMPLGVNYTHIPWEEHIFCTDACLSGYAVMETNGPIEEATLVGRSDERWRFKRERGMPPREKALQFRDVFDDPSTVLPDVEGQVPDEILCDEEFPEVPVSLMQAQLWHEVWSTQIFFKEPVHLIEARSVLGTLRHFCKDSRKHGRRLAVLNDNMGVVLAVSKGRCHDYRLLRILRRMSALSLSTGVRLHLRWVPSELNVADEGSRKWESKTFKRSREEKGGGVHQTGGKEGQRENDHGEKREAFSRVQERSQSPHREGPQGLPASSALRKVLKAHTKRKQLSTQRLRKNAQRMRASIGEKSLLEAASIKVNQRLDYAKRLEKFYSFAIRFQLPLTKIEQLDEALCEYADHEYLNGEAAHCGEKLQAALEYERPEFSRAGALHLPRFRRCMKGWRKMAPTQTRLPMPEFMKSAISAVFLHQDFKEEALYNEVTFSTYSRPGEMLKVHAMDVVPPNRDFGHCVIVLGPMERGESSKVGIYDEVLILDDVRCPWLPTLLHQHSQQQINQFGQEAPLWNFSARQYLVKWRRAVELLGFGEVATTPYQNRHGGASRDHLKRLRSVAAIQRRGRWASDSSARIYDKPGRMQQVINQFGSNLQDLGEEVRRNFNTDFRNGTRQLPRQMRLQLQRTCRM